MNDNERAREALEGLERLANEIRDKAQELQSTLKPALRAALSATATEPKMILVGYVHPEEIAAALFESGETGWGSLPISPEPWGVMTMPLYRAAVPVASEETGPVEIRPDENGDVDEIVMKRGAFHLERLQENTWWVGLYPEGMRDRVTFVFTGKKTKVTVTEEFVSMPEPQVRGQGANEAWRFCSHCGAAQWEGGTDPNTNSITLPAEPVAPSEEKNRE